MSWTSCGDGFQCARLRVPLNWAHSGAGDITLALVRLPATGSRIGSLVLNPGGPGGSGVTYARAARRVVGAPLRARFDVVGFDPRGVAGSTPVDCVGDRDLDALLAAPAVPDTAAETAQAVTAARGLADGCRTKSARLLPHVSTADVARDMDVLRAALGDRRLSYLGKSYGTFLGAIYAEVFPGRLRVAVLDGAVDPALSATQLNETQAGGFELALRTFLQVCGTSCGSSYADAIRRLDRMLAAADAHPIASPADPSKRRLTAALAIYGLAAGLYSRDSWPVLAVGLRGAEQGDGSLLLRFADRLADRDARGHYSNSVEVNSAVNCTDRPAPRRVADYAAAAAAAARRAPHFGGAIAWGSLACAFWRVPASGIPHRITAPGAPPILVIGTTRDPATPYAWAVSLAHQLSTGILLTRNGDGHTAYLRGNACVDRAVEAYVITARAPRDGTRC